MGVKCIYLCWKTFKCIQHISSHQLDLGDDSGEPFIPDRQIRIIDNPQHKYEGKPRAPLLFLGNHIFIFIWLRKCYYTALIIIEVFLDIFYGWYPMSEGECSTVHNISLGVVLKFSSFCFLKVWFIFGIQYLLIFVYSIFFYFCVQFLESFLYCILLMLY